MIFITTRFLTSSIKRRPLDTEIVGLDGASTIHGVTYTSDNEDWQ